LDPLIKRPGANDTMGQPTETIPKSDGHFGAGELGPVHYISNNTRTKPGQLYKEVRTGVRVRDTVTGFEFGLHSRAEGNLKDQLSGSWFSLIRVRQFGQIA